MIRTQTQTGNQNELKLKSERQKPMPPGQIKAKPLCRTSRHKRGVAPQGDWRRRFGVVFWLKIEWLSGFNMTEKQIIGSIWWFAAGNWECIF